MTSSNKPKLSPADSSPPSSARQPPALPGVSRPKHRAILKIVTEGQTPPQRKKNRRLLNSCEQPTIATAEINVEPTARFSRCCPDLGMPPAHGLGDFSTSEARPS